VICDAIAAGTLDCRTAYVGRWRMPDGSSRADAATNVSRRYVLRKHANGIAARRGSATNTPGRVLNGSRWHSDRRSHRRRVVTLRVGRAVGAHSAGTTSRAVKTAATGGVQPRRSRVYECQRVGSPPVAADAVDVVPLLVWQFSAVPSRIAGRTPFAGIPPEPATLRRRFGDLAAVCERLPAAPRFLPSGQSSGPLRRAVSSSFKFSQKQFVRFASQKCFVESFVGSTATAESWLGNAKA
jgi:hypothetical protein